MIETFPRNAGTGSQDPKANARQTTITAERALGDDPTKALAASLVHINRASLFDPSVQGKVESIDFYLDLMNLSGSDDIEVHYAVVIQQAGAFFQTPLARLTGLNKWKAFISEPLLANDFVRIGKPTTASPHAKPQFAQNAPPMQFGYVVHAVSRGRSLESVSRIGEWKVSVAHREDLSMSLSQTLEFKQRLDSEILERQRLERAIMEQKTKAEQELREQRLKAEEELKQLRMSLPQVITRPSDVSTSTSLSTSAAPPSLGASEAAPLATAVDNKYLAIFKAAQESLQAVEARRRADRQRKEKLAEEHEQLRRTIELERHGREEAEQKWSVQFEVATRTAAEEKRKLGDELESYRKRIFHLEQELRSESKAKDQKAEELHRLRHEAAAREQELMQAADQATVHAKLLEDHNARTAELEEVVSHLNSKLAQLEDEKRDLEDQVQKLVNMLNQREREWSETSEQQAREAKAAQEAADARLAAELEKWLERLNECQAKHAEQEEALRKQHDEERAQLEDALAKMNEAHERKVEAWKRTTEELKKNLAVTAQELDASNDELQRVKETLLSELTAVETRLQAAQAEAAQRAEETEAAKQDHESLQQELRANIERLGKQLHDVQSKWEQDQAEWEQSKWQTQLESSEVARQHEEALQALRDEANREREAALAAVRAESAAETRSAVNALQARLDAAEDSNADLAATVARLELQLREKADREEELMARVFELENCVADHQREVRRLTDVQHDAQRGADDARARMQAQAAVAHELEARLDEVTAERAHLAKELEEEKASRKKTAQERDTLQTDLATEKALREKIARELLAVIEERKVSERQQASVIAALNEHLKKQAEAIVQLDHALKQEQADHADAEEQILAEIHAREQAEQAREQAEQALRKLQDLVTSAAHPEEDTEWELVTDAHPSS